jgi:hypothetical protein
MADQLSLRGGTTTEHGSFTGANKEVTVDTTKKTLVVHDGATVGGHPIMRENGSNSALALGSAATPSLKFTGDPNTGIYSPGADQLAISTNGTGRLFVNSAGKVLIGYTSDQFSGNLQVSGTARIGSFDFGNTANELIYTAGTDMGVGTFYGNSLYFKTNNTERMRLDSSGRLGLGTSSPSYRLSVVGDAGTNIVSTITSQVNTGSYIGYFDTTTTDRPLVGAVGNNFVIRTNGVERVRFDSAGRVGIGTTSPNESLEVAGNIHVSGADRSIFNRSNNALTFGTNNAERARIDSSGRLLVGTSTARSNLFSGGWFPTLQIETSTNGGRGLSILNNRTDDNGPQLTFGKANGSAVGSVDVVANGNTVGAISFTGSDGTNFVQGARITGEVDGTPGANDMPGRLVFSTTSDGSASPVERLRITSTGQVRLAGAGITFNGDTAAANELDDYEEGTFTPTVVGTTTAGTATYSAQAGKYTKVGDLVTFTVYVSWSAGTGAGDLKINGLPFTVKNVGNQLLSCSVGWIEGMTLPASNIVNAGLYPNETRINIQSYPAGGGSFTNTTYDATAGIAITGSYFV